MLVIAIYWARIDPANVDRLLPDSAAVERPTARTPWAWKGTTPRGGVGRTR
jgi:hypothetical protein